MKREVGMGMEKRIKQSRRKRKALSFTKGTWGKQSMQQTMYASLRFFFSDFNFPKEASNDFESSVQISALYSRSLSLSWHYRAQQHPALDPASMGRVWELSER